MFTGFSPRLSVAQAQKDARLPTLPAAQLQKFQLETDTQVMRFWRSLWGLTVKQPNESRLRANSPWSHVAKVTRWSILVLLLIERVWEKKCGCDCEAMHYSVSWESAATLRTHPCCFQSTQLCVGVLEMQVEHHVAEKWVLWLWVFVFFPPHFLKFLQHYSSFSDMQLRNVFSIYPIKKNLNVLRVRNAEISSCTWQLCTISIPLL